MKLRRVTVFLAAILSFSGCTLDEVQITGETCPPNGSKSGAELSYIQDLTCTAEDCSLTIDGDPASFFNTYRCPNEYPACAQDADDLWYCSKIACKSSQHVNNGKCENDTIEACGSASNNCLDAAGWKNGNCINGQCIATQCKEKYELRDNQCQAKSGQILCETGTHFYADDCEQNSIEHCGAHDKDCTKTPGWKDGACTTDGQCLAIACTEGYQHEGTSCSKLVSCTEGQHSYEGTCEDDSVDHCGSHDRSCADKITGWQNGICENGECIPSECQPGYCLDGNQCTNGADNLNACGIDGKACVHCDTPICQNGKCSVSSCNAGYHIYGGSCEADSSSNCGKHGNSCNPEDFHSEGATAACENSTCVLKTCNNYFHVYNNTCEKHTIYNCSEHGKECKDVNATKSSCANAHGVCMLTCKSGFAQKGEKCVKQ